MKNNLSLLLLKTRNFINVLPLARISFSGRSMPRRRLYIGFVGLLAIIVFNSIVRFNLHMHTVAEFRPVRQSSVNNSSPDAIFEISANASPEAYISLQSHNHWGMPQKMMSLKRQVETLLIKVKEVRKSKDQNVLVNHLYIKKKPEEVQRPEADIYVLKHAVHRDINEDERGEFNEYHINDGDAETRHKVEVQGSVRMSKPKLETLSRDYASETPIDQHMHHQVTTGQSMTFSATVETAEQLPKKIYEVQNEALTQSNRLSIFKQKEVNTISNKNTSLKNADQSRSPDYTEEDSDYVKLHRISQLRKARERKQSLMTNWEKVSILQKLDPGATQFSPRLKQFLDSYKCSARFFLTWFSPASKLGTRERICLQSIFKFHPNACVVILSRSLDTECGVHILKPFVDAGYHIIAAAPDLPFLFRNTSAELWFRDLQQGKTDPGTISLSQNLSNLLRLSILYKFGGIYIDTDVIVLRNFGTLSNCIGAQSIDASGHWTRLNNAVLIFDKHHPILLQLIQDFTRQFDGSKWGHNGPYLVSRVIKKRTAKNLFLNLTVLPPKAFYPASWQKTQKWFHSLEQEKERMWRKGKLEQLQRESYAFHLWNKQTKGLVVEPQSIIDELFQSYRCFISCES